MTVSVEQLQAFVAKYPPSEPVLKTGTAVPETRTDDAGSYTHERLGQLLEMWSDANPDFSFSIGRTSKGVGYHIVCPGCEGWPDGARHTEQAGKLNSSAAVWVENGHPRFRCSHAHCDQGALGGKKTWKHLVEAWDAGGHMQRRVLTGAPQLGSITVQNEAPVPNSEIGNESQLETKAAADPSYPSGVWDGTEYGEFAEICSRDNYIPPEFLIEAIKTVTGAVLGSSLSIPDIEGGIPRFYTVLMGSAGSGKGTSISWASSVFKDISLGGTAVANLLWSPATVIQDIKWTTIGACEEGFNSAPGMQRSNKSGQKRWLQTFEELDHMIEGSGIDGSGKALMGVNRQLYDREDFSTTTTGKRDAIAGKAQNSILSATTPEIWTDMFAGKSVRGSGLFQRFNLIVSHENRKKGSLRKPRLDLFKVNFAAKIMDMDKKPLGLAVSDKVLAAMDEWFTQEKFANPEVDGEVRGRLNVLAWRNALHLAWQRGLVEIGMRELQDAFLLSEYQFEMRIRHTPAEGDNTWALVENKIRNFLRVEKKASRRDIVRALNLHRYGGGTTDKALSSLSSTGEIKLFTIENLGPKSTFAVWQD